MANHDNQTARARSSSHALAKNLPEGPSCFEVQPRRTRSESACKPEASFEYRRQANRTCPCCASRCHRSLAIFPRCLLKRSLVVIRKLWLNADVWAELCPLCRMRGSFTCSELAPRTHLHHRRRELLRSMCCRFRNRSAGKVSLRPN